jgi:hypothetical protein
LSPDLTLGQFQNSTNAGVSLELPFARLAPVHTAPPPPPRPAAKDSTGRDSTFAYTPVGRGFSIPVGRLLSRLGNVSVRGTFSRTTGFARYFGVPSVPYRLGLARDTSRSYNSQVSNQQNLTFPDFDFDWGGVQRLMGLGKVFPQLGARSRFSRVDTREGVDLANPTSKTRSQNYSPLLSLQGTSRGQAVVQLSIDHTSSSREDFSSRRATREEGTSTVRTSVSRTYLPGQKPPVFGGKGLKASMTLQADAAYTKRTGSTNAFGSASSKTNNDRIDVNASNTYAFSTYVNGTLGLGFSQSRDLQLRNSEGKPLIQRSLRLEAAATFRF